MVVFEKEQEFKDGDILAFAKRIDYPCPFIYKGTDKNGFHKYYIGLDALSIITLPNCTDARWGNGTLCYATEKEKQLLFDKMKEQGLQWNAEEKRVEKIRWRAGVGESFYFINSSLDVLNIEECWSILCDELNSAGNYFHTKEQAKEAVKRVKEVLCKYHEEIGE